MRISILVYLFPTIFATKETHSTMCRIDNRKYLVRWICVIMLMLIQFDAYGYDTVNVLTQEEECQNLYDATLDTDNEKAEWSDYRYRVVKQGAKLKPLATVQEVISLCVLHQVTTPIYTSIHLSSSGSITSNTHLLYCTLRI